MSDAEYFTDRALNELRAAMLAYDVRVRIVHLELTDAYTAKLEEVKRVAPRAVTQRTSA